MSIAVTIWNHFMRSLITLLLMVLKVHRIESTWNSGTVGGGRLKPTPPLPFDVSQFIISVNSLSNVRINDCSEIYMSL